ncbi:hypothetical protein PIROE2DRAFT_18948, partial [Piromyces sp. E2]
VISGNNFSKSIPTSLGKLTKLKVLDLSTNYFTGSIPDFIGNNLTELEELYLYDNQLEGSIPETLLQLKELRVLTLSENQLTGPIPDSIENLSKLEFL